MAKSQPNENPPTAGKISLPFLFSDASFHLLVDQITDYAIFLLTPTGEMATWNSGAQRIKGYKPQEIIGKHFRNFYGPEAQAAQIPEEELKIASTTGRFEDEGWRFRSDGSRFWANVIITAIRDKQGRLLGFGKVTRDLTERKRAEDALSIVNRSLIEAHEAERAWLARELHDDVSQRVALVALNLEKLRQHSGGQTIRHIEEAAQQISELASDIQALSHRLHPSRLELQGLIGAAQGLCRELSDRNNIAITLHSHDIPKELPQEVAVCLFRVLQEALQNAMKHSGVRQFEVSLNGALNEIQLTVQDAGAGFDPEKASSGHGLGLTSMRERLNLVNGQLLIDSQLLRGTTIRARVPLSSDSTSRRKFE
jgi:PAS domain S-box-containing protein